MMMMIMMMKGRLSNVLIFHPPPSRVGQQSEPVGKQLPKMAGKHHCHRNCHPRRPPHHHHHNHHYIHHHHHHREVLFLIFPTMDAKIAS